MDMFKPTLKLIRKGNGSYTLLSVTLTPNSCYKAEKAYEGVPEGHVIVPEATGVILPITYGGGICLQVITSVKHRLDGLELGEKAGKEAVVAFAVLNNQVVGVSSIRVNDYGDVLMLNERDDLGEIGF